MEGLPKGMIPDKDNVVYYDTEKSMFYMIKWGRACSPLHKNVRDMSKWTCVEIDKATLPNDGDVVEYWIIGDEESPRFGVFQENNNMFWSSPSEFHFTRDVDKWRLIERAKKMSK